MRLHSVLPYLLSGGLGAENPHGFIVKGVVYHYLYGYQVSVDGPGGPDEVFA